MSHQDWNTITIHSANSKKSVQKDIVEKNTTADLNNQNKKLENDNENFAHTKIPGDLSREITNLRNSMRLTQKDMASKLCIPLATYTDLENRKSIYNQQTKQLIQKIERTNKILFMNK
jgi:DNA-binding transcriptional regulator YiaG